MTADGENPSHSRLSRMPDSARPLPTWAYTNSPSETQKRPDPSFPFCRGPHTQWTRIYVSEVRDGRVASGCQFDLEEEAAAFAYAEERIGSVKA
jgi:hypothetical protein